MQGLIDTPPEIAKIVRTRLMARSNEERFLMGVRMFDAARRMVLASLPTGLSDLDRKQLLFERLYGKSLALTKGLAEKSAAFVEKGAEVYAKA